MTFSIDTAKRGAKDAFIYCSIGYLLLFIILLLYRLETRWYYMSKQQQKKQMIMTTTINDNYHAPTDPARAAGKKTVYRQPALAPYQITLRELYGELETVNKSLEKNMEQLGQQMADIQTLQSEAMQIDKKFDQLTSTPEISTTGKDNPSAPSFDAVKTLLSMKSLNQVQDPASLSSMFEKASSELSSFFNEKSAVDIDSVFHLNILLREMAEISRDASETEEACVNPSARKRTRRGLHSDAITKEHFDDYIHSFDPLFQRRTQSAGVAAVSPDNESHLVESIDAEIQKAIDELLTQAKGLIAKMQDQNGGATIDLISAAPTGTDGEILSVDDCIDTQFVYSLVEAGLSAQNVGGVGIREALLKRAGDLNPTAAKEVILDADLPLTKPKDIGRQTSSSYSISSSINLRDVIDTPLLVKSIDWIDQFVDMIGGHNDNLDRYLDSWTAENNGGSSVGEAIVQHLLQRTGSINVDPKSVAEKYLPAGSGEKLSKILGNQN